MKVLITGSAGFIGYHLVNRLLQRGDEVTGIDCINDYYDIDLKYCRLLASGIVRDQIEYGRYVSSVTDDNYRFVKLDLSDAQGLKRLFEKNDFDVVINMAAQAGVRYSLVNPSTYIDSNVTGFLNVLECCRNYGIKRLLYASSSSVYGLNSKIPFSTNDKVDRPISLYAATKKSNELMAHAYSHLFNIHTTGLRFFTVYGPWGRPDMALFTFTKAISEGRPIHIYNNGDMRRDFTYVDDIIEGVIRAVDKPSEVPNLYNIYNIGRGESVSLMEFVKEIEKNLGIEAEKKYYPMQDGDVSDTWADITEIQHQLNYKPKTSISEGIEKFIRWYTNFYSADGHRYVTNDFVSAR